MTAGTVGFQGFGRTRRLELPNGVNAALSPPGRAALRYNPVTMALELSVEGSAYIPVSTGPAGASPWVDDGGGNVRLQVVSNDVVVGAAAVAGTEKMRIIGDVRVESQVQVTELTSVPGSALDLEISSDTDNVNLTVPGATGLVVTVGGGVDALRMNSAQTELQINSSDAAALSVNDGTDTYITADTVGRELMVGDLGTPLSVGTIAADDVRADTSGRFRVTNGAQTGYDVDLSVGTVSTGEPANPLRESHTVPSADASAFLLQDDGGRPVVSVDTSVGSVGTLDMGSSGDPISMQMFGDMRMEVPDDDATAWDVVEGANEYLVVDTTNGAERVAVGFAGGGPVDMGGYEYNTAGIRGEMLDNTAATYLLEDQTGNIYVQVDTTAGSEAVTIGNSTTNPAVSFPGTGNVDFGDAPLCLNELAADPGPTADTVKVYSKDAAGTSELFVQDDAGNVVQITSGGSVVGGTSIPIADNDATAFRVFESVGGDDYILVDTTDGAEEVVYGNATTNPDYVFLGSGDLQVARIDRAGFIDIGASLASTVRLGRTGFGTTVQGQFSVQGFTTQANHVAYVEQGADPGFTAAQGKVYTKDVAAVTELFYLDDTGAVVQITSGGAVNAPGGTPGGANTQVQFNDTGSFNGDASFTFDGTNVTTSNAHFADGGVDRSGAAALSLGTTNATSVSVAQSGVVTTVNGSLAVSVGGASILGTAGQLAFAERTGDPGATANQGKVYTKDVAAVTELFYLDDTGAVVQITSGGSVVGGTSVPIADNDATAFRVFESVGGDDYILVDTTNGSESIDLGNATTVPDVNILGSTPQLTIGAGGGDGQLNVTDIVAPAGTLNVGVGGPVTAVVLGGVTGSVNVQPGLNLGGVTGAVAGEMRTAGDVDIGGNLDKTSAGTLSIGSGVAGGVLLGRVGTTTRTLGNATIDGTTSIGGPFVHLGAASIDTFDVNLPDNINAAFTVRQGVADYIQIDTTNGSELLTLGIPAGIAAQEILFAGGVAGATLRMAERTTDPVGNANEGILYGKDVGAVTELFYVDSGSNAVQITDGGVLATPDLPTNTATAYDLTDQVTAATYFEINTTTGAQEIILGGSENPVINMDTTGDIMIGNASAQVAFLGGTGSGVTAAYTVTNPNTVRSFDTTTVTVDALAEVVGTMIADLQLFGLYG